MHFVGIIVFFFALLSIVLASLAMEILRISSSTNIVNFIDDAWNMKITRLKERERVRDRRREREREGERAIDRERESVREKKRAKPAKPYSHENGRKVLLYSLTDKE